jgi:hypothetical protein
MDDTFSGSPLSACDPSLRFIEFECGHLFEVSNSDNAMAQFMQDSRVNDAGAMSVRLPVCPVCKVAMRRLARYGTIVNSVLHDLEMIKLKQHEAVEAQLEAFLKLRGAMSEEERRKLVEEQRKMLMAVEGRASHWFKCSKGHLYVIGDCGGAMERSQCPECGEGIGGQAHQLVNSSRPAFELGSGGSAWMPHLQPTDAEQAAAAGASAAAAAPPPPPPEPQPASVLTRARAALQSASPFVLHSTAPPRADP